jgi:hypothetical protein
MTNQPEVNLASEILNNLAMVSEIVSHLTPFDLPIVALVNKAFARTSRKMIAVIVRGHIRELRSKHIIIKLSNCEVIRSRHFKVTKTRLISGEICTKGCTCDPLVLIIKDIDKDTS